MGSGWSGTSERGCRRGCRDRSLLPEGQAAYRLAFRQVTRHVGAILIAIFSGGAFIRAALITYRHVPGPPLLVWRALYPNFFYLLYGVGSWLYVNALWELRRLGNQALNLRAYYADNMMGLRAIGSLALSISSAFFGFLGISTIQLLLGPVVVEYLATLGIILTLGVVLFFLPLNNIHKMMINEKTRLRTEFNDRLVQDIETVDTPLTEASGRPTRYSPAPYPSSRTC